MDSTILAKTVLFDIQKARGVTTPSGYALTKAGNDRDYAIASCISEK
jgi:hypothetical protein